MSDYKVVLLRRQKELETRLFSLTEQLKRSPAPNRERFLQSRIAYMTDNLAYLESLIYQEYKSEGVFNKPKEEVKTDGTIEQPDINRGATNDTGSSTPGGTASADNTDTGVGPRSTEETARVDQANQ
jgi:hypothetical protein